MLKNNPHRKSINYYAELAYDLLHNNETNLPFLIAKQSIQLLFDNKISNYGTIEADRLIRSRLALIDGFYSTNINSKRFFAFDDIIKNIWGIANSDEEFVDKLLYYIDCIGKLDYTTENEIKLNEISYFLEKTYGVNKLGDIKGIATSLLTKYCYFITNYRFPIYDDLVIINYNIIANRFNIDLDISDFFVLFDKYVSKISIINNKIGDFEKLDSLLWLFGKIRKGSYSLILQKGRYLDFIRLINKEKALNKLSSKKIDEAVSNYIRENIYDIDNWNVFTEKQIEFIRFVYDK